MNRCVPPRRTPTSPLLPSLGASVALVLTAHAQEITDVQLQTDPVSLTEEVEIVVEVPGFRSVQIQSNPFPSMSSWSNEPGVANVISAGSVTFTFPISGDRTFYRALTSEIEVFGEYDSGSTVLSLGEDTSLPVVLDLLNAQTGESFYPQVMDTELYRQLGDITIPAGEYGADNPDDLGLKLGIGVWAVPPLVEDGEFSDKFRPTEGPQDGENIQIPGGDLPMGTWQDEIQDRVISGQAFEPGEFDMPFIPEIDEVDPDAPLDDLGIRFPGTEARAFIVFERDGSYTLDYAGLSEGSPPSDVYPPLPSEGSLVIVTRADFAGLPSGILQISTKVNPFFERSYNPPGGGSHGQEVLDEVSIGFGVPLILEDQPEESLGETFVEIYQYRGGLEGQYGGPDTAPILTPDFFDRNEDFFEPILFVEGKEIAEVLNQNQPSGLSNTIWTTAPTSTTLHRSGSNGSKVNIAIIGDGFDESSGDQDAFNDYVQNVIMEDFLGRDVHPEILNAINVFRINTTSEDSGVTQVDASGNVTNFRDTALEYRFSGEWERCWMEPGPFSLIPFRFGSTNLINAALAAVCPQADIVFLVLNEGSFGGCAGGNRFTVTRGGGWAVNAHEFGHLFGKLGDEYGCSATNCDGTYMGGEPGGANLTTVTNRNTVKWSQYIPSWRPVVTNNTHVSDTVQDVGIFRGAVTGQSRWNDGIFRPSLDSRMRSNSTPYNPPSYEKVRDEARPFQEATFRKNVTGDFNGDGFTDLVLLDGRQLSLYLAETRDVGPDDPMIGQPPRGANGVLQKTWFFTDRLIGDTGWRWPFRPEDKFFVGDFDGDGDDDIYIFNAQSWNKVYVCMLRSEGDRFQPIRIYESNLPGWQMTNGDKHYVADFNKDGRDDLIVYNGSNWVVPYLVMLRSDGNKLSYVRRYDQFLPGWEMGRNERIFVGDFNGDGKEGFLIQDRNSWAQVHLRVYNVNSSSSGVNLASRYYGPIEGDNFTWTMNRRDDLYVGDFDGDGTDDMALFNGFNWNAAYLGLFESRSGVLLLRRAYSENPDFSNLPGWQLDRGDKFWVGNFNGDQYEDLIVYNHQNWDKEYLGMCTSDGSFRLQGRWQKDWIGGWNLSSFDDFKVADFRGVAGWDDLFVFNKNWFGLLRSHKTVYQLESLNYKWINQERFHSWGIW